MSYRLGVDVGGTFTDFLLLNEDSGETHTAKVPSTPEDSSIGVLNGVARICEESGVAPGDIELVMHGTTVATNAVLPRRRAPTGIPTTAGFRDTPEIGRQIRTAIYDLELDPETPVFLAPGARRVKVTGRIAASGEVFEPLDEAGAAAARDLSGLR